MKMQIAVIFVKKKLKINMWTMKMQNSVILVKKYFKMNM